MASANTRHFCKDVLANVNPHRTEIIVGQFCRGAGVRQLKIAGVDQRAKFRQQRLTFRAETHLKSEMNANCFSGPMRRRIASIARSVAGMAS